MSYPQELGLAIPIEWDRQGGSATRRWKDLYANAIANAPKPGQVLEINGVSYPHMTVDRCRVVAKGITEDTGEVWAEVEVSYSARFDKPKIGDPPRIRFAFGTDAIQAAGGRQWYRVESNESLTLLSEYVNEDEVTVAVPHSVLYISMVYAVRSINLDNLMDLKYKVNDRPYSLPGYPNVEFPTGTILVDDLNDDAQYDFDLQDWYHTLSVDLSYRSNGQNYIWYPGKKSWDADTQTWERNADGSYVMLEAGQWRPTYPLFYEERNLDYLISDLEGTPGG
jgi:hypothetical protein